MIIISGNNSTIIGDKEFHNINCPNCKIKSSFRLVIIGEYFYLYYIPFSPSKKFTTAECLNCKIVLTKDKMNTELIIKHQEINEISRYPIWYFFGSILLIAFIIFIFLH